MTAGDRGARIAEIQRELETLPKGSISRKTINGKVQCYLQWRENGMNRSKYISHADVPALEEAVARRRALKEELSRLTGTRVPNDIYYSDVMTGDDLDDMIRSVEGFGRRDSYPVLKQYVDKGVDGHVCILYGLRRTGKTTMMRQAIADLSPEERARAAYIMASSDLDVHVLSRDLRTLHGQGFRYVFIDEVTAIPDFIDGAAIISDLYATMGMRIVLSGTDSLGFHLSKIDELYGRTITIHTTWIPFGEYSRLMGAWDIDEYIRLGGILHPNEISLDQAEEFSPFSTAWGTDRYVLMSISRNIQNSLEHHRGGERFHLLFEPYSKGELIGMIGRVIEDMNRGLLEETLAMLAEQGDGAGRLAGMLADALESRPRLPGVSEDQALLIGENLKTVDLVDRYKIERYPARATEFHTVFTQPGMRYRQAAALLDSLLEDPSLKALGSEDIRHIREMVDGFICGVMMEDIVLYETTRYLRDKMVFKYTFDSGEYDMVVYDPDTATCMLYEVKHSTAVVLEQRRHLNDPKLLAIVRRMYGKVTGRYVIYLGEPTVADDGVEYLNVADYLCGLRPSTGQASTGTGRRAPARRFR
ncbi:MAG: AAA family ATPase [Thermoplasmata archaeon]|nr:AAA family ATPase [Thermoplasmata archaeon]